MLPLPTWLVHREFDKGVNYASDLTLNADERFFFENRARATCLVDFNTPNLSYEYDDYALCMLDDKFYVFHTHGCSCPSPEETWYLASHGGRNTILDFLISEGNQAFSNEVKKLPGWSERF